LHSSTMVGEAHVYVQVLAKVRIKDMRDLPKG